MAKSYGTVSAEQKLKMSGLEFVQGLASGALPLNTIARTLGYDVTEAENGRVVVTLLPTDAHLNPAGTVHGGLTATLLDSWQAVSPPSLDQLYLNSSLVRFRNVSSQADLRLLVLISNLPLLVSFGSVWRDYLNTREMIICARRLCAGRKSRISS